MNVHETPEHGNTQHNQLQRCNRARTSRAIAEGLRARAPRRWPASADVAGASLPVPPPSLVAAAAATLRGLAGSAAAAARDVGFRARVPRPAAPCRAAGR